METIYSALGYFIMPLGVIPDVTPVVGFSDDLDILLAAVCATAAYITDGVRVKAEKRIWDWFG